VSHRSNRSFIVQRTCLHYNIAGGSKALLSKHQRDSHPQQDASNCESDQPSPFQESTDPSPSAATSTPTATTPSSPLSRSPLPLPPLTVPNLRLTGSCPCLLGSIGAVIGKGCRKIVLMGVVIKKLYTLYVVIPTLVLTHSVSLSFTSSNSVMTICTFQYHDKMTTWFWSGMCWAIMFGVESV